MALNRYAARNQSNSNEGFGFFETLVNQVSHSVNKQVGAAKAAWDNRDISQQMGYDRANQWLANQPGARDAYFRARGNGTNIV